MSYSSAEERFWEQVRRGGPGDCWEWQGGTTKNGYGEISVDRKMTYAHRFAWELAYGAIPKGASVCHHCDNRLCVNPHHLFLGTQAENVADMVKKARQAKGGHIGNAKLTRSQVLAIRCSQKPSKVIAQQFGISYRHVNNIKAYKRWGWLT